MIRLNGGRIDYGRLQFDIRYGQRHGHEALVTDRMICFSYSCHVVELLATQSFGCQVQRPCTPLCRLEWGATRTLESASAITSIPETTSRSPFL